MNKMPKMVVAVLATLFATTTFAQQSEPAVDPATMVALEKMGAYLRSLEAFRVKIITTNDTVLEDGQKIQYENNVDILAKPPNDLRIHTVNDRHERLFFFDGKTFTLWGQRMDYYATVDAPDTIGKLADMLDDKYGMDLPGLDLFRWGTPEMDTKAITGAMDVGSAVIQGTTCQHYIFRQDDIDWQVWIQKGDYPLPRKVVITTRTDDARPQHTAQYQWDLAPSFNDAAFTFNPPKGALRVVLEDNLSSDDANE
ncbi:MAG: DUF2092 domain-containing protein [Halioglobus sp.]|nr:DUF2092 domain-containing protein [Halioglobus sp.]